MTIAAACAPPGGGRNPVTPRFIRHFSILCLPTPSDQSLKQIFKVIRDTHGADTRRCLVQTLLSLISDFSTVLFLIFISSSTVSLLLLLLLFFCSSLPNCLQAILKGFLGDFTEEVMGCAGQIVDAAVEIYNRLSIDLLPTPAKSHYVFNLRDLSKCVQGGRS